MVQITVWVWMFVVGVVALITHYYNVISTTNSITNLLVVGEQLG